MARIQVIEPEEASGELRTVYARIAAARGRIANVWKAESSNPAAMDAHLALYMAIMYGRSGLTRRQREMIAMTVSETNGCRYCTTHHTEALLAHLKDPSVVRAIRANFATASIEAKDRAMLEYAAKLARTPSAVTDADIERLRQAGLADREIVDATLVTSYFGFVNRLVLGLGVALEEDEERTYKY